MVPSHSIGQQTKARRPKRPEISPTDRSRGRTRSQPGGLSLTHPVWPLHLGDSAMSPSPCIPGVHTHVLLAWGGAWAGLNRPLAAPSLSPKTRAAAHLPAALSPCLVSYFSLLVGVERGAICGKPMLGQERQEAAPNLRAACIFQWDGRRRECCRAQRVGWRAVGRLALRPEVPAPSPGPGHSGCS